MQQLPIFVNLAGRQVILVGDGEPAEAKARLVRAVGGELVGEHAAEAVLAFVAIEDDADEESMPEATRADAGPARCAANEADRRAAIAAAAALPAEDEDDADEDDEALPTSVDMRSRAGPVANGSARTRRFASSSAAVCCACRCCLPCAELVGASNASDMT